MEKSIKKNDLQSTGNELVKSLEGVFKQLPHLPENIREVLVNFAPIVVLVCGVLGLLGGLSGLFISPLGLFAGPQAAVYLLVSSLAGIASGVLLLLSYSKLKKREYAGWMLLFYTNLVSIITVIVSIFSTFSIGSILGVAVGLYILFEIKGYYK